MTKAVKKLHRFEPFEQEHSAGKRRIIAGIDEAGRGALAGPLSIGLAIFDLEKVNNPPEELSKLNDSKKLSPAVREKLYPVVQDNALFSCSILVSSLIVDRLGISAATEFAVIRALERAKSAGHTVDTVLMDGNYKMKELQKKYPAMEYHAIVGGDSRVFSIAAASILAKVRRDRRMVRYEDHFPGYDLGVHKGYGTRVHREAIKNLGPAPIHRRSYSW